MAEKSTSVKPLLWLAVLAEPGLRRGWNWVCEVGEGWEAIVIDDNSTPPALTIMVRKGSTEIRPRQPIAFLDRETAQHEVIDLAIEAQQKEQKNMAARKQK